MTEGLSVVLITFNEGHHIAKCLKAAQAVADEIIVIDSGSTDNTVDVCKAYGARVVRILGADIPNKKTLETRRLLSIGY